MARIAFIGDIGGHSDELYAALVYLGADPGNLELPEDLIVVQVGDLIHRGPDSKGVLDIVEKYIQGRRWVQLIGNHEANEWYEQFIFERVDDDDLDRITHWYDCGHMHIACAVRTDDGEDILITHAGLTKFWYQWLGERYGSTNLTAREVAMRLNGLANQGEHGWATLLTSGMMLGGEVDYKAGPIWAHAGREVAGSWMRQPIIDMPFHQVHGHTTMYYWSKRTWNCNENVAEATTIVQGERRTFTEVTPGKLIHSVDPGLGAYGGVAWKPLVVEGRVLV